MHENLTIFQKLSFLRPEGGVRGHFSMLNIYERAPEDGQEEKNRIKIRPSVQKLARAKSEVYNVIVCNFQP